MPLCETQTIANAKDSTGTSVTGCYVGSGAIGSWVSGAKIYSFGDGKAFNYASSYATSTGTNANLDTTLGTWHNISPFFEANDMDVCSGHAASGDYQS